MYDSLAPGVDVQTTLSLLLTVHNSQAPLDAAVPMVTARGMALADGLAPHLALIVPSRLVDMTTTDATKTHSTVATLSQYSILFCFDG